MNINQSNTTSTIKGSTIPEIWPGALGIYKYSKRVVMKNLATLIGLIGLLLLSALAAALVDDKNLSVTMLTVYVINSIIGSILSAAITFVVIASIKGESLSLDGAIDNALKIFWRYFLLNLIVSLLVLTSILMLIVPAFFIVPRLSLSQYYLIEGKLGVLDSIKASWFATKPHVGKIWGIIGVTLLLTIPAIPIIGAYFGLIYSASLAVLYFFIKNQTVTRTTDSILASSLMGGPTPPSSNTHQ